jgi:pimeloyl-ACP methyl ester carboxylesterase
VSPTELFVDANQLRHRVLEWDGGSRTTVLCLHGFLDLSWGFAPLAPALARAGFHVLAPDLRGHGLSDRVGKGGYYHFMDYLFDVTDLVDRLARERLVLVGHSMGGMIASLWAGTFPARVERLAILEGLAVGEPPLDELPRRTAEWVASVRRARERSPRVHASIEDAAARLREHDPRCPPDVALLLAEKGTRPVPGGFVFLHDPVHLTRGPYPFRIDQARRYWESIRCPVLIVDAEHSEIAPRDAEQRRASFRTAEHAVIPGAGHMMIRHRPAELAARLLAFLGSPARGPDRG